MAYNMVFKSYEDTKTVRKENGIKITRYDISDKNGYKKLKEEYIIRKTKNKKLAVSINRVGEK